MKRRPEIAGIATFLLTPISYVFRRKTDMYLRVRRDTWDRNNYFAKKTKTSRLAGRRREHGRGRPRLSRERQVRWRMTRKQRTGRRASSRANSFAAQKRDVKTTCSIAHTTPHSSSHMCLYPVQSVWCRIEQDLNQLSSVFSWYAPGAKPDITRSGCLLLLYMYQVPRFQGNSCTYSGVFICTACTAVLLL